MAKKKKPRKLSDRMQAFAREYIVDLDKKNAAIRAGYSPRTAESQGVQLYNDPRVKKLIDKLIANRAERLDIKADNVLQEIAKSGFSNLQNLFDDRGHLLNIQDVPKEVADSIASIEVVTKVIPVKGEAAEVEYIHKIKMVSKENSLRDLGKHLKLFTEKHDVNLTGDISVTIKDYKNTVKRKQ